MVRAAIDRGVNYVDTAYVYHEGKSESFLGKALSDGYREKVKIATKLPMWNVKGPEDFDRLLKEQLERLQTEQIDFYLFHALDKNRWRDQVLKIDLLEKARKAREDGRIAHIGFSFHDDFAGFEEILNGSDLWEFCQIQYNYMDTENQAGERGLKMAAEKGLAVVIMEPLLGGRLAVPPKDILQVMEAVNPDRPAADWALQWLWNQPEVSLVLSGMSTMEQVEGNLHSADISGVGSMQAAEGEVIAQAREIFRARTVIPCTKCGYCMPCPTGVNIPGNFEFYNYAHLYEDLEDAKFRYKIFLQDGQRADQCVACGACLELCPQSIPISEWMPKVDALLA